MVVIFAHDTHEPVVGCIGCRATRPVYRVGILHFGLYTYTHKKSYIYNYNCHIHITNTNIYRTGSACSLMRGGGDGVGSVSAEG